MKQGWQTVDDVSQGTQHLRTCKRREEYLPRERAEESTNYGIRLARAVFFNAFERTLHGLVGMVFRKEPTLGDDVPEAIRGREASETRPKAEGLAENIDNAGTHWTVFAKEVFSDAMRDGHAFIYVDMPPALPPGSTLADERAAGRRPYWVSYKADQAVNWRTEVVNGKARLAQITFKECSYESDGEYGEKEVVRYRVLRPGEWYLYREVKGEDNAGTAYLLEAEGQTSLPEIPVTVIYSRKTGFLTSRPPLLDLALLNICHYQKYSDYSIYLHIASRPILWFKGRDTSNSNPVVSPYSAFDVDEQNGLVAVAETSGAALGAARQDLEDLKGQMSALGLSIVAGKSPQPERTATEDLLDHVEEESDLATAGRSLKDGLERALYFTALYLDKNAKSGGSVELGATIQELTLTAQDIQAYSNLVALKQLSLETMWTILARAGRLPADFNPEQERQQIATSSEDIANEALTRFDRGQ